MKLLHQHFLVKVLKYQSIREKPNTFRLSMTRQLCWYNLAGWQVCTAPDVHLCSGYLGWKDVIVTVTEDNLFTIDLSEICAEGCSALAYLWRQTPCLTALHCPVYSADAFRLPVTPWIFVHGCLNLLIN
eukprot:TRINITY_DN30003_c0_g1_i1.p1 TRINITY_DN30003_c0_g1~~TRINITY_DN30003_c0_g1_i1.p1  ORF type:complete len:129 (-),score=6.08 TRINITY_DN30003_c0_g1_i1:16-402(-)